MTLATKIIADDGERPPPNTKRVYAWADLPPVSKPAKYRIEIEGQPAHVIRVANKKRRVLEGLMNGPLMAASYCRLSDNVLPLRRDHGVEIICTIYKSDDETNRDRFGVYTLGCKVTRLVSEVAA